MKDIIFEHKPARYDSGSIQTIALYILPAFFILIAFKAYILATLTLVVGPFIIHFLKKLDPPTFDGWVIEFDKIVLLKNIKSGIEKKEIAYLDINKLTYFSGARKAMAEFNKKGFDFPEWAVLEARIARLELIDDTDEAHS